MHSEFCKLCGAHEQLRESHIISKLFYRKIMSASATGKMRTLANIKKREQDGAKKFMLCAQCEDKFSRYETEFSKKYAVLFNKTNLEAFHYTTGDYKLFVSLVWRSIAHTLIFDQMGNYKAHEIQMLMTKEEELRNYLLGKTSSCNIEIHAIPVFGGTDTDAMVMLTQYSISTDVLFFDHINDSIVIITFPKIIICAILDKHSLVSWKGTITSEKGGVIWTDPILFPVEIQDFCSERHKKILDELTKLSPETIGKIINDPKTKEKYANSPYYDILKAMHNNIKQN